MWQVARNVTMADWGFLEPEQYLIHDRDGKFCPASQCLIDTAGVKRVALPARSPNLNAFAERGVRSVKDECCSNLILFGEGALRHALQEYVEHYQRERPHQGKNNVVLIPAADYGRQRDGPVRCRERLGGLLHLYERVKAVLDIEDAYPLLDETFREGWDAPGMADYDRYNELKHQ